MTLVVIVNEAFCIIDYLKLKDISIIVCHRALALAQKQKNYSEECALGAVVDDSAEGIQKAVGAGYKALISYRFLTPSYGYRSEKKKVFPNTQKACPHR